MFKVLENDFNGDLFQTNW